MPIRITRNQECSSRTLLQASYGTAERPDFSHRACYALTIVQGLKRPKAAKVIGALAVFSLWIYKYEL